jgi:hypothetical protein
MDALEVLLFSTTSQLERPELPIFGILAVAEGLERSAKDTVLTRPRPAGNCRGAFLI